MHPPSLGRTTSTSGLAVGFCRLVGAATGAVVLDSRPAATIAHRKRGAGTVAHAGLGQHQLDTLRRLVISCDLGDDRADLLVAGHRQERRRAAIGFHAGEVEAWLRLRQLARTVRAHGAAAMQVGIYERCQNWRTFQCRVERNA